MSVAVEDFPRRHRITVREYCRMAETGELAPDARVELIEGEIIEMSPIGPWHIGSVGQLIKLLSSAVGDRAIVLCQCPFKLSEYSMPEPDFVVLAPRDDDYKNQYATPDNVYLAIEVSDTSLRYDLKTKMPLYGRYGVPEVWIIDREGQQLHLFRDLVDGRYEESLTLTPPGGVPISALTGVTVDLSALFK